MERLQKLISQAGAASRREAERMILAGRVAVDGVTITELGVQADINMSVFTFDGKPIKIEKKRLYFLLNKPKGYICAVKDDRGRKTIIDLFPEVKEYIYPVGRLDYDTEGLLLVTNDGELMNGLLHPRYEVNKTYIAKVEGVPRPADIQALREGVMLEDGRTAPAKVRLLPKRNNQTDKWSRVELTIHEGRNRQVRRMLAAVGHPVMELKRVAFAGLDLKGVIPGKYRALQKEELAMLQRLAGRK
ncbi:MAG: rRNA pseudouridine synthase [Selenomonadaceae bacterium]|nr:rRNA pseudouridine synthase [Selenomonadaceae bacterium]